MFMFNRAGQLKVLIAILFIGLIEYTNEKINYYQTNARIIQIISDCIMEKEQGWKIYYSDKVSCFLAENAVKNDPEWLNFNVKYNYKLKLFYRSPIDNKTYYQILDVDKEIDEKNKYKTNATFTILVDRSNPEKIKEPSGIIFIIIIGLALAGLRSQLNKIWPGSS